MTSANIFIRMPWQGVVLAVCLLAGQALAGPGEGAGAQRAVSAAGSEVPLVPRATIVRDAAGTMSAEEILAQPPGAGAPEQPPTASFGFTAATYWFAVALDNPTPAALNRLLVVDPTWLDDVRVTLAGPDGSRADFRGGDTLPFEERAVRHRKINFELSVPPGRSRLIVRTQTRDPFLVGLTLWERGAFFAADREDAAYFGVLYGATGALLLFNLFLFFSVREKVYAAYVAYLSSFLVMHATYNGHAYEALWRNAPAWGNWAHSAFIYMFMLAGVHFAVHFLELHSRLPRAGRATRGFLLALAASFVMTAALGGYALHVSSSILWVVFYSPFILLLGVLSLRAGNRAARYFLTATAAGFIGSFVTALAVSGLIPYSTLAYRAVDAGMLVDAVLLSLALADRLRLSRLEADSAKAKLIEAGRAYTRQLEETVAHRTLELSQANAVKDKFFAIVAHDLRGPIGSLASLFREGVTAPADITPELLEAVRETTQSTDNFLEELLTWARSQRGEIDCRPVPVNMSSLLREAERSFLVQARAKGVELDLATGEDCWVSADLAMINAVLRNLLNNALKFTESGGSVRASIDRDDARCRIAIADTGVGMAPATLEKLFRLDAKLRSSPGTREERGTGMGLILCREFVERNGGSIGVDSEPGKGSSFWFTLPFAEKADVVEPDVVRSQLQALRVLLVENDSLHREASARVLRDLGCSPAFAADGAEAVAAAAATDFDLILMDVDMPGMNGIEATKRIRAQGGNSHVASLSSYSRQELNGIAGDFRFDEYLFKPLNKDEALVVMATCLAQGRFSA